MPWMCTWVCMVAHDAAVHVAVLDRTMPHAREPLPRDRLGARAERLQLYCIRCTDAGRGLESGRASGRARCENKNVKRIECVAPCASLQALRLPRAKDAQRNQTGSDDRTHERGCGLHLDLLRHDVWLHAEFGRRRLGGVYGCTDVVCGCTDSGLPPTVRPGRSNSSGPAGASAVRVGSASGREWDHESVGCARVVTCPCRVCVSRMLQLTLCTSGSRA